MKLKKKGRVCWWGGRGADFCGGRMCLMVRLLCVALLWLLEFLPNGPFFPFFLPYPPAWQRAPFSYFTCCDFTEPFQLVVNSSFVPGPSVNSARGSPSLTTHRNRLSKQRVSGPQTQRAS